MMYKHKSRSRGTRASIAVEKTDDRLATLQRPYTAHLVEIAYVNILQVKRLLI